METPPAGAEAEPLDNRIAVLILQHPQEQDKSLGTAALLAGALRNVRLKIGLSWPNLGAALGRPADPQRWAVLYLGSARPAELIPGAVVVALDRHGAALADQAAALAGIEGVLLLDGSWGEAKTLWWRNPWLLKLRRVALAPPAPSRYGSVRKEPRHESLSTLEAAALLLAHLEEKPEIGRQLEVALKELLARHTPHRRVGWRRTNSRRKQRSRGGRR